MKSWKRYKILLLNLSICLVSSGSVQDTLNISVNALFERGLDYNLKLYNDKIAENIARNRTRAAIWAQFPDIELKMETGGAGNSLYPFSYWNQHYEATVMQPVYHGGKIGATVRASRIDETIAILRHRHDEGEIKLMLLRKYFNLVCEYARQDIWRHNMIQSQKMLDDIRNLKREGLVTNNDVLRAELHLTNDSLSLSTVINNIIIISQELDLLLGLDENYIIKTDNNELDTQLPNRRNYDEYLSAAYHNNPALMISEKIIESSKNKVRIAQAAYLPQIDFIAGNTLARPYSGYGFDRFNNHWSVGLSVTIPISSLYKNRSLTEMAHNEVISAEIAARLGTQEILTKLKKAYLRHSEAINKVTTIKLAIKQAEENFRIMKNRYMNQLAILTDLLNADALCIEAKFQYISAKAEAMVTFYELKQLCGEL